MLCKRKWRTERDSNPRYGCPYTRVPGVRLQPLGHLSFTSGNDRLQVAQYTDENRKRKNLQNVFSKGLGGCGLWFTVPQVCPVNKSFQELELRVQRTVNYVAFLLVGLRLVAPGLTNGTDRFLKDYFFIPETGQCIAWNFGNVFCTSIFLPVPGVSSDRYRCRGIDRRW